MESMGLLMKQLSVVGGFAPWPLILFQAPYLKVGVGTVGAAVASR